MTSDLKNNKHFDRLKVELDGVTKIITSSRIPDILSVSPSAKSLITQVQETDSLLERCSRIVEKDIEPKKPTLRLIHHFACSGGTLISKCISALPSVYLLSEMHPHSINHMGGGKPKYLPSDLITMARYANFPSINEFSKKIFVENIKYAAKYIEERGGILVLREHTHIDYCVGERKEFIPTVDKYLSEHFVLKHLVTVRNPIDSYSSLVTNNWVQHSPSSFDEYCKRLLSFLEQYPAKYVIRYEDFVENPDKIMKKICKLLSLPFDDRYRDIFDVFSVTGDSGRKSHNIGPRERRPLGEEFIEEIKLSKSFKKIVKLLKYEKEF